MENATKSYSFLTYLAYPKAARITLYFLKPSCSMVLATLIWLDSKALGEALLPSPEKGCHLSKNRHQCVNDFAQVY